MAAVLFAVAAVLSGCTKDELGGGIGGSEDGLKDFEISTYATVNDDANARTGEDKIFSAMVYIYQAGTDKLDNADSREVSVLTSIGEVVDNTGKLNKTWRVPVGNKDVYVVANPHPELKTRLTASLTQAQLQALLTANDVPQFKVATANIGTQGMLMSGKKTGIAVSPEFAKVTGTVEVTRRMARIEFMLRKSKELEGSTVQVTKLTYKGLAHYGSVYPLSTIPNAVTATSYEEVFAATTISAQQATAGAWSGTAADYTPVTYYYSYERAAGTKAVELMMTVNIDGKEFNLPVYLCSTSIGSNKTGNDENKPVALEPNKIYRVMGTLGKQTTDITLDILDWNDVNINGDIYGSELAVSQSRILLDWYRFGGSFSTTVDLISNNNIDFLGYVCGYDPGTPAVANKSLSLPAWLPNSNISGLPDGTSKTANINLTYILHNTGTTVFGSTRENIYLWFKAGNIYKCIEVIYDNSYIPYEVLKNCSVAWSTNTPAGVVFAKKGNYHPSHEFNTKDLYDQLVGEQLYIFASDVSTDVSTSDQYGAGFANTAAYIAALGANATGPNKCKSLGAEWYVPSLKEMETLRQLQGYLGTSYMMVPSSYWTSTASANAVSGKGNISLNYELSEPSPQGVAIRNFKENYFRCIMNHELLSIESTNLVADYWNWGNSFTKSVAFTSKDGAVTVKSIDNSDATKNWLTGAVISGDKVNITYAPTAGYAGVHNDVAITLQTAGGTEKTITVKYDNGYITHDMLVAKGWKNAPDGGIHVNKTGLVHPNGSARDYSYSGIAWATVATSVQAAQQTGYGYGPANTSAIITTLGDNAPAANACRALGSEWYLPSKDELSEALYPYKDYMGGSYAFGEYIYWSSTESSSANAWYKHLGNGKMIASKKEYNGPVHVRCVRDM